MGWEHVSWINYFQDLDQHLPVWTYLLSFWFQEMLVIRWLAEPLQEGLCAT